MSDYYAMGPDQEAHLARVLEEFRRLFNLECGWVRDGELDHVRAGTTYALRSLIHFLEAQHWNEHGRGYPGTEALRQDVEAYLVSKYRSGQREHGGLLCDKPGMTVNAIAEQLDAVVYGLTRDEQLRGRPSRITGRD